jgi:hypothetical protein
VNILAKTPSYIFRRRLQKPFWEIDSTCQDSLKSPPSTDQENFSGETDLAFCNTQRLRAQYTGTVYDSISTLIKNNLF